MTARTNSWELLNDRRPLPLAVVGYTTPRQGASATTMNLVAARVLSRVGGPSRGGWLTGRAAELGTELPGALVHDGHPVVARKAQQNSITEPNCVRYVPIRLGYISPLHGPSEAMMIFHGADRRWVVMKATRARFRVRGRAVPVPRPKDQRLLVSQPRTSWIVWGRGREIQRRRASVVLWWWV